MSYKKYLLVFLISFSVFSQSTDYTDDAAEVDFYVPGLLANDGMQQVNFLLCFMESINFTQFVDKNFYAALTDEKLCESADGADSTAEAAAATGSSANSSGAGTAADTTSATKYTYGVYSNVTNTTTNSIDGKGWVNLLMDVGPNESEISSTAFLSVNVTADKSATNKFGTFEMRYDIRNDGSFTHDAGFPVTANSLIAQGYLKVDGSTIQYTEKAMAESPRSLYADLTDSNNQQGYIITSVKTENGASRKTYAIEHQVSYDEGDDLYCQKFVSAQEYTFDPNNLATNGGMSTTGSAIDSSTFAGLITTVTDANGYVNSDGGSATTLTSEHCWDTKVSSAKRVVYEYGTYKNSDETRYDLSTPSMSLQASLADNAGLSRPIYAHASYWGTHVEARDRDELTNSIIFKNRRDNTDTNSYKLTKNYIEVRKRSRSTNPLITINGTNFQWYIGHYSSEWQTKLQALDGTNGITAIGSCTAAGGCPEYSGNISVNNLTKVVTFTLTEGMDWQQDPPINVTLTNPITFTNTDWVAQMTVGGWSRGMHFWSPDTHAGFDVPFAAFQTPDGSTEAQHYRTTSSTNLTLTELDAELGSNNLMCLRECLSPTAMNAAMAGAFTAYDANQSAGALDFSPYQDVGPYFKEQMYYDNNPSNNTKDAGEDFITAGRYNNIGGIIGSEIATYTVTSSAISASNGSDTGDLTWTSANQDKIDAGKYENQLRKYEYYEKAGGDTYTVDNNTRQYGWAFHMRAVLDNTDNRNSLKCDADSGNARGYDVNIKKVSSPATQAHAAGTDYYCEWKLWNNIDTTYEINITQRPKYTVMNGATVATISPPELYEYTVPSGLTYNFDNTDLTGKKIKLKFEGFGELHNFPGRVVDTCTGTVLGKYHSGAWNECYRYIHEFVIPEGTVLSKVGGSFSDQIKIRPLRGDEYLAKLATLPTGRASYTKSASDLPAESNLQDIGLSTNANFVGAKPVHGVSGVVVLNSGEASVIHGKTIVAP